MLYKLDAVKDNLRNREGKRVFYLGKSDQLTSEARDWLNRERIAILPAEQAAKQRYALLRGGYVEEKPEHMTHLNGDVLVSKLHPRILFRGAVDHLEAELILAQLAVGEPYRKSLEEILNLARKLIRCDVLEEKLELDKLCGLTEAEMRKRSHRPQEYYGQAHFMPSAEDGMGIARLNQARCACREAELKALAAFSDREGNPTRVDILRALNRMSSMIYILMVQMKAEIDCGKGEL